MDSFAHSNDGGSSWIATGLNRREVERLTFLDNGSDQDYADRGFFRESIEYPAGMLSYCRKSPEADPVLEGIRAVYKDTSVVNCLAVAQSIKLDEMITARDLALRVDLPANVTGTTYIYSLKKREDYTGLYNLSKNDGSPRTVTVFDPVNNTLAGVLHTTDQLGALLVLGEPVVNAAWQTFRSKYAEIFSKTDPAEVDLIKWE